MTLDEAIKHAEEVVEKKERDLKFYERVNEECKECAEEHRQLAEWLKELKQLREQTKWILISERLPEKNVEVLIATEWDCITIGEMFSSNDWHIHEGATNAGIDDIKAWMPLPQPHKAESEETE